MRKVLLVSLLSMVGVYSNATQAEVSFSLGYIHTKMDNADSAYEFFGEELSTKLNGINLKASFESDETRLGIITSLSYSARTTEYTYRNTTLGRRYTEKLEQSYVSLLVGPSFKATSWFTPYGLVGVAFNGNEYRYDNRWGYYSDDDDTKTAFAFGGGIQIHPFKLSDGRFLIDLSYERALFKNNTTDSFVIGAGYRF